MSIGGPFIPNLSRTIKLDYYVPSHLDLLHTWIFTP